MCAGASDASPPPLSARRCPWPPQLEAQISPKPPPSTGLPAEEKEEEDGDFADWDESAPMSIAIVPIGSSAAAASGSSVASPVPAASPRSSLSKSTHEEPPAPPPEPDFFGSMNMTISSSSVQVTRVAAKRPLHSSPPATALANPNQNIYASASSSNAHSSRFSDALVEEVATSGAGGAWGDDDLDDLLGATSAGTTASTALHPSSSPTAKKAPRRARDPTLKKPRGIGAVAVAMDDDQ